MYFVLILLLVVIMCRFIFCAYIYIYINVSTSILQFVIYSFIFNLPTNKVATGYILKAYYHFTNNKEEKRKEKI